MIPQQATLQEMREEIERIDAEMVPLVARRGELIRAIGSYKRAHYDGTPLAVENNDAMQQHALAVVGESPDAVWVGHMFRRLAFEYEDLEQSELYDDLAHFHHG